MERSEMTNRDLYRVFLLSNITVVKTLILKLDKNITIDEIDLKNLVQMESELKEIYVYFKSTLDVTEENKYLDIIQRLINENKEFRNNKKFVDLYAQNKELKEKVSKLEIINNELINGL
jgi:hypothetical protein